MWCSGKLSWGADIHHSKGTGGQGGVFQLFKQLRMESQLPSLIVSALYVADELLQRAVLLPQVCGMPDFLLFFLTNVLSWHNRSIVPWWSVPGRYTQWSRVRRTGATAPVHCVTKITKWAISTWMLFACTGCDYTSFFAGLGKASFLNAFLVYQYAICGSRLPGLLSEHGLGEQSNSYLAFQRLVGTTYFKCISWHILQWRG